MNASCKPSIASEVHARHKRPHRLALLATSPVVTGESKIGEPRKGTETAPAISRSVMLILFKNQNPARGRKPSLFVEVDVEFFLFKNQNPARGRKLSASSASALLNSSFKNQNPARGRKPRKRCASDTMFHNLRTRTPQGDGNGLHSLL